MHALSFGVLFPILVAAAHAQTVSVSLAVASTLNVTANGNGQTAQGTHPAGPLFVPGGFIAPLYVPPFQATPWIRWSDFSSLYSTRMRLEHDLDSTFVPTSNLTAASEFLVTFTATGTTPVYLELGSSTTLPVGAPWPQVDIDIFNDGYIEYPNFANGHATVFTLAPLGAASLVVRVIMSSQLVGPGHSLVSVDIAARPDNNLLVTQNALACSNSSQMPHPEPVFASSGVYLYVSPPFYPHVFVIGLSQQPLLLPPYFGLPCLLVPSPDIVLWEPSGLLHVPLPASVRPLTFHAQTVVLTPSYPATPSALVVTDGWTVTAL